MEAGARTPGEVMNMTYGAAKNVISEMNGTKLSLGGTAGSQDAQSTIFKSCSTPTAPSCLYEFGLYKSQAEEEVVYNGTTYVNTAPFRYNNNFKDQLADSYNILHRPACDFTDFCPRLTEGRKERGRERRLKPVQRSHEIGVGGDKEGAEEGAEEGAIVGEHVGLHMSICVFCGAYSQARERYILLNPALPKWNLI